MSAQWTRRVLVVPILLLALGGLAACADDSGSGVATASGTAQASENAQPAPDTQAFVDCMRDNGIEMTDPDPQSGRPQIGPNVDIESNEYKSAMDVCQDLLPAANEGDANDPEKLEQLKAFAACMRENGMPEFPDPQAMDDGSYGFPGLEGGTREDPAYQAAAEKCNEHLVGEG